MTSSQALFTLGDVADEYPHNLLDTITKVVDAHGFDSLSMLALEAPSAADLLQLDDDELLDVYNEQVSLRCSSSVPMTRGKVIEFCCLSELVHIPVEVIAPRFPDLTFYTETLLLDESMKKFTKLDKFEGIKEVSRERDIVDTDRVIRCVYKRSNHRSPYYTYILNDGDYRLLVEYLEKPKVERGGLFASSLNYNAVEYKSWLVQRPIAYCDYKEWTGSSKDIPCTLTNRLIKFGTVVDYYNLESLYWQQRTRASVFLRPYYLDECDPSEGNEFMVVGAKLHLNDITTFEKLEEAVHEVGEDAVIFKQTRIDYKHKVYVIFTSFTEPIVVTDDDERADLVRTAMSVVDRVLKPLENAKYGYDVLEVHTAVADGELVIYNAAIVEDEYPLKVVDELERHVFYPLFKSAASITLLQVQYLNDRQFSQFVEIVKDPVLMSTIGKGDTWSDAEVSKYIEQHRISAYTEDSKRKYFDWCLLDHGEVVCWVSIRPFEETKFQIRVVSKVHRKGYGKRAVFLAHHKYYEATGNKELYAVVNKSNYASHYLFNSLEWKLRGEKRVGGKESEVYVWS